MQRVRTIAVLVGLVATTFLGSARAAAQEDDHSDDETTTTVCGSSLPGAVGIGDRLWLTGATVIPPDGGAPTELDAYQAAVFTQSWIGLSFVPNPEIAQDPPPDSPITRVDLEGEWAGQPGTVTVYYTIDGEQPYIGFPGLIVRTPEYPDAPEPSNWFGAPALVAETITGEGELQETTGTQTAECRDPADATDGAGEEEAAGSGDDSGSDLPWATIAVGLAVVLIGGGLWMRSRRTGAAPPDAVPDSD
jgi:hypothetical protein